jgi:hypothetical protein
MNWGSVELVTLSVFILTPAIHKPSIAAHHAFHIVAHTTRIGNAHHAFIGNAHHTLLSVTHARFHIVPHHTLSRMGACYRIGAFHNACDVIYPNFR